MFIKKQLMVNSLVVALAVIISAGVIWVARAEEIDTDCDPDDLVTYYADTDEDDYGDPADSVLACSQPTGYVENNLDCDDTNAAINPEATEACDLVDNDCDSAVDEGVLVTFYFDGDNDAFGVNATTTEACVAPVGFAALSTDCNDTDFLINPAALEVCDEVDNDCNSLVDDDCSVPENFYKDSDGDGFGDPSEATSTLEQPDGYVANSGDCNDTNASINPGASEVCDLVDNNCDARVDEGLRQRFYLDADNDSYGDAQSAISDCSAPEGYVTDNQDCNDAEAQINPGANEICDEIDNDCDGVIDEDCNGVSTFYRDADSDSYGDSSQATTSETQPSGYVANAEDCNDSEVSINPGATEVCDDVDNDCDGTIDEGCNGISTFYLDADGDGFGDTNNSTTSEAQPNGYVANDDDCNDDDADINPDAVEVCNFVDNNCDGRIDEGLRKRFYLDVDDDGFGNTSIATSSCTAPIDYVPDNTDCNDNNSSINPDATEVCDEIDNNCDGSVDEGLSCDDDDDCNLCQCLKDCLKDCDRDCDRDHKRDCDRDRGRGRGRDRDWDDDDDDDDDDSSFKNHGQWVSNMAHLTNLLRKNGDISSWEKGQIMKNVAKDKNKKNKKNKKK